MIQFDEHIFQTGWFNHQLEELGCAFNEGFAMFFFTPNFGKDEHVHFHAWNHRLDLEDHLWSYKQYQQCRQGIFQYRIWLLGASIAGKPPICITYSYAAYLGKNIEELHYDYYSRLLSIRFTPPPPRVPVTTRFITFLVTGIPTETIFCHWNPGWGIDPIYQSIISLMSISSTGAPSNVELHGSSCCLLKVLKPNPPIPDPR